MKAELNLGIILKRDKKQRVDKRKMNWNTIYITGNPEFKDEVSKKLEHSDLNYMPGNNGSAAEAGDDLYWLDDTTELRKFKEAIGGKLIWKYRLRFFDNLEDFLTYQNTRNNETSLTDEDKALINEMRNEMRDEMKSHAA